MKRPLQRWQAGLAAGNADGRRRIYAIGPRGFAALRSWLDQFWGGVLVAFAAEVERDPKERNPKPRKEKGQ
jgi:hypothetical protein